MREFHFPVWGWVVQVSAMLALVLFAVIYLLAYRAVVKHEYTLFAVAPLFICFGVVYLRFFWVSWPFKVILHDDDTVEVYTKSRVTTLTVAEIYSVRFGRGIWLYHARGKFAFSACSTNNPLWEFITELAERNPNFVMHPATYLR
jgi:hypothetical protein